MDIFKKDGTINWSSDKQNMTVDCYILWNVSDPQQFYRALGATAKAEERLNAITYNALKKSLSGDEKTVILDADSELAKILMGAY